VSTKQGQIIVVLLAVSIVLGGVNTYLILDNQKTQEAVNGETRASFTAITSELQATEVQTASNYADLDAKIATTSQNLSALDGEVAAQGAALASVDSGIKSSLGTLGQSLDTLGQSLDTLREDLNTLETQTPTEIYEDTYRSVVLITTSTKQGSGFLYDSDKHIVTNWHVVSGYTSVDVTYYDGTMSTAMVVGTDPYSDVAVILPATIPEGLTPLTLGNSTATLVGDPVVAVGNPLGVTGSLSSGYVSRKNAAITVSDVPLVVNEFQLDLTIAPGSSGGALLNVHRDVIGVTNAGSDSNNYSFAIPSNIVKRVADSIIEKGKYEHPLFGFSLIELSKDNIEYYNVFNVEDTQRGLMITTITAGGAAQLAELKAAVQKSDPSGRSGYEAQDIILAVNGHTVNTFEEWSTYIEENISPGQTVELTLWRLGETVTVKVTPTARTQYS
jgi:S1-C subfamily serine protease